MTLVPDAGARWRSRESAAPPAGGTPCGVRVEIAPVMAALHEEKPGDAIGHYKLLQKLGEGDCGMVWMAEQEEPEAIEHPRHGE